MITIKSINCPNCGAPITQMNDLHKIKCSYCNARLIININDEHLTNNIENINTHSDTIEELYEIEVFSVRRALMTDILLILTGILMKPFMSFISHKINNSTNGEVAGRFNQAMANMISFFDELTIITAGFMIFMGACLLIIHLFKYQNEFKNDIEIED